MSQRKGETYKKYFSPNSVDPIPESTCRTKKRRKLLHEITQKEAQNHTPDTAADQHDEACLRAGDNEAPCFIEANNLNCEMMTESLTMKEVESIVEIQSQEPDFENTEQCSFKKTYLMNENTDFRDYFVEAEGYVDEMSEDIEFADTREPYSLETSRSQQGTPVNAEEKDHQHSQGFAALQQMMAAEDFLMPIDVPVQISVGELLMNIVKYALVNCLTLTALLQLMQLINCIFVRPVLLSKTKYLIEKLFNPANCVVYHATCTRCHGYIGQFTRETSILECRKCEIDVNVRGSAYKDFFVTMDISTAISEILEANGEYYNSVVHRRRRSRCKNKHSVQDIYDGKEYRRFLKSLDPADRNQYVTITFNTDGAPVFESSSYSIWPIQLMINELPFRVRNEQLLVAGLWFGKDKPDMNVFLDPFVRNMNELSEKGVKCNINGEERIVKVYTLVACVDSVARAPMQGLTQFNGSYGCNWCLHSGEWVRTGDKPNCGSQKYPLLATPPEQRNAKDTINHMEEALNSTKPVYGVKNASQLINLKRFDIIKGFVPDSMHCCSGVAKQFAKIWFGSKKQSSALLKNAEINEINTIVSNIKAPNQIARLARSVIDKEYWKAREWENWILFYSLPALDRFLPRALLMHWALFVEALYILLQTEIPYAEIDRADELLHKFVVDTERLYSKSAMTFNVHLLLHLANSVLDWGPLWAHTAFGFESGNGQLLKTIFSAKGVHQQICRHISLQYSSIILKERVLPVSLPPVKQYFMSLSSKTVGKSFEISTVRYFGVSKINAKWIQQLELPLESVTAYDKIVKNGCLYLSSTKKSLRSNNSFAQLCDGSYIKILQFIVVRVNETSEEYTLAQKVHVRNAFNVLSKMLVKIVKITDNLITVPTMEISKVCVHVQNVENEYISAVPNMYFY